MPLAAAPHDVGVLPAVVGRGRADGDRGALADHRGGDAVGGAGGLVAQLLDHEGHAAGPGGGGHQELALLEDLGLQFLPAHGVHQPLEPGPELVVAVPVVAEDPEDGLDGGHQLLPGRERLEGEGGVGVGAEATGDEDPEAGFDGAVVVLTGGRDDADVVEHGLAAVGGAAGEVDLELAGEALTQRVAQEVLVRGLGPGADVEDLVRAGAGEVAALHVAHGVATGLPAGEADRRDVPHEVGDALQRDEVDLDVLAGGDVAPAPGVLLGDVAEHVELIRGAPTRTGASPAPSGCGRPGAGRRCRCSGGRPGRRPPRGRPTGSARAGPRTSRCRRRPPDRR